MRKAIIVLFALVAIVFLGSGCAETPHLSNPTHWGTHFAKIFGSEDGELHNLHVSIDRVLFGVENYEEVENTEKIYTH